MEELKLCPHCSATNIAMRERYINCIANRVHYRRECTICHATFKNWYKNRSKADAAWNRRAEPENKPLTIDELREMDGDPVWCVDGGGLNRCCLVNAGYGDCIDNESASWNFEFYGMTGDGKNGLHPMGWIAYRHKQKEDI